MTMSQFFIIVSYWLHSLATVVLIGNFILLALVYLPVFVINQDNSASGMIFSELSRRSRGWLYAAFVIFILTGIYLTLVDPNYLGLGNFGNTWSVLMLVKHILVVGMIGVGLVYNAVLRIGPQFKSGIDLPAAFSRFKLYSYLMAGLGMLVLLLTAVSQAL
jgi:uncharacterized membrane protein